MSACFFRWFYFSFSLGDSSNRIGFFFGLFDCLVKRFGRLKHVALRRGEFQWNSLVRCRRSQSKLSRRLMSNRLIWLADGVWCNAMNFSQRWPMDVRHQIQRMCSIDPHGNIIGTFRSSFCFCFVICLYYCRWISFWHCRVHRHRDHPSPMTIIYFVCFVKY